MAVRQPAIDNDTLAISPEELTALEEIEQRVLWLSTQMIHHANNIRQNPDKSKVGGHQASSASVVSIITALYFHVLTAGDRVSIKPHASPVFHSAQYLLGNLDRHFLTTLREFKGLQAYPSRTKDPDNVDFSTGSVGLGAVAPVYAALAAKYAELHFGEVTSGRFFALIGDAELDEGNVWETVAEEAIRGIDNVTWIVDLNRQSLDRVIPGVRADRLKALFAGAGWHVFEAKYGHRLTAAMDAPSGDALRRRIDEMSNEEYQSLIRLTDGAELRKRLLAVADATYRKKLRSALKSSQDDGLQSLISNLGGHDLPGLIDVLEQADTARGAPSVVFAYTIKGFGLPMAGDPLNHSQLLTQAQMDTLRDDFGIDETDVWARLDSDSPGGQAVSAAVGRLGQPPIAADNSAFEIPVEIGTRNPKSTSTQEALGRSLTQLASAGDLADRIVTMSPDVATSTHLSGWINKMGVFAFEPSQEFETEGQRMLKWEPNPDGQHIELGISEMNLFMALGQFGLASELTGQHLIPIGTVYDPFVCRGLDALIYSLYTGAKMIFAGTPAGVSLSPEGGAHQSTITTSIGIELPDVVFYEPAFAKEVEWILMDGIRACCDRANGYSTYLRLSTKSIDQSLMQGPLERLGEEELRRQVLAGGYRLYEGASESGNASAADIVNIFVGGIMAPDAVEAARTLSNEGVAANIVVTTSPDRLHQDLRIARLRQLENAHAPLDLGHLETLVPPAERSAPIVTIQDGSSHALSFLGSVFGVPVVPLGVDEFGQSGSRDSLYQQTGIGADSIVNAALLALDLVEPE